MPAPDVMGMLWRLLQSSPPAATPLGGTDQQFAQSIAQQSRFDTEGELPSPGLPPGLPDAVMRSILTQPSYAEGQPMGQGSPPSLRQEESANDRHGRERGLSTELDLQDIFRRWGEPIPEGGSYPNAPRYPSPLNQFMGRLPGMGLY